VRRDGKIWETLADRVRQTLRLLGRRNWLKSRAYGADSNSGLHQQQKATHKESLMNKLRRSWILFKCSVSIVLKNKKLLVFPILSFIFTMMILGFVIMPVAFQPTGHSLNQGAHWKAVADTLVVAKSTAASPGRSDVTLKPVAVGIGIGIYMVSMFLATFFNVAFFHQILQALRGNAVSVQAGFRFAISKLSAIAMWSLFAGVVGLIIKTLEERMDVIGRIIMKFVGTAW